MEPILSAKQNHALYRNLGLDIDRTNIIPYRYANAFEVSCTSLTTAGVQAPLWLLHSKTADVCNFKARYANFNF